MRVQKYRRSKGQCLQYTVAYDQGEYLIRRDGEIKKVIRDAFLTGIAMAEARPDLMLRTAVADIEGLFGMDE